MNNKERLNFDGKTVVITGSTRGIGYGYAQYFAALGANLVINGVDESRLEAALESLESSDGEVLGIAAPVEEGERIIEFALSEFPKVDAVINNAGFVQDAKFKNMSLDQWDAVYRNHLEASFRIVKAIWPHFLENGGGKLLLTSSSAGIFGNFGQANYSAAKGGVIAFGKTLAIEGKKANIKVNTICPGAYTDMNAHLMDKTVIDGMGADKVSPVAAWLCHDSCNETGAVIEAAGGLIAKVRTEYSSKTLDGNFGIETVRDIWEDLSSFESNVSHPASLIDAMRAISKHVKSLS
jgi:3-hydroxyacyl-CoA dehydrogenase/3a,7a,12a-trihydroxy-5b-cholest-24-enoyl-CoA hydratase